MSILIRLKSDAKLAADFDRMLADMRRANRAQPRTAASIGLAKSIGLKLKVITNEMQRRAGVKIGYIAASDAIVNEVNAVAGGVSDVISSATNKMLLGLALVGFVLYQYKKK